MTQEEKEYKAKQIQNFRYSIIAELANPYLQRGERRALIKSKASRQYQIPYSSRTTIGEECIRNWLRKFRKYGLEGLLPRTRKDSGKSRKISEPERDSIITALEKDPYMTARAVVIKLQKEGEIQSELSSSALSRLVKSAGLSRENRIMLSEKEMTRKFNFFSPLECVQADDMHGFPVPDGSGKKKKAILIAFIDDATRRIVYSNFSFTEKSVAFEEGLKHILKAHGRIGQSYTDNGSTFVSNQTKRILDTLGILNLHSRPGIPKGRGKIERFFRTVRDQFLRPLDQESVKGLGDLNARFRSWLETEYHRTPHRGLEGKTPMDAWLSLTRHIIRMDPTIDLDHVFLHEEYRKIYKDSTFTLHSVLYEVPSILIGKKVRVLYDPSALSKRVLIECDKKSYGEARLVDTYANTKVKRNYKSNRNYTAFEKERSEQGEQSSPTPTSAALAATQLSI